jgi:Holliday junction DNA helicase RuvA
MYDYMKGKITDITPIGITLEVGGIGYFINVANPYSFEYNKDCIVYLYHQVKEDEQNLFGFKNKDEKSLFLKLINVKGLGCKMALPILATGSINRIIEAIESENIAYLKKFPKIGEKLARQMILDLRGKIGSVHTLFDNNEISYTSTELHDALIALGYKDKEIKGIENKIDSSLSIEDKIKEALKLLLK